MKTVVLGLLALFTAVRPAISSADDILSLQVAQFKDKNSEQLLSVLTCDDKGPTLRDLGLGDWVSESGSVAGLDALRAAANLCKPKDEEVTAALLRGVGDALTLQYLLQAEAFIQLRSKDRDAALNWLTTRANRHATCLDLLVVGAIYWGDRYEPLSSNKNERIGFDDAPLDPQSWGLAFKSSTSWRTLLEGKNAAYRLLAARSLEKWADQSILDAFIADGASVDSHDVRDVWLYHVQKLPPERRMRVLDQAIESRIKKTQTDPERKEIERHFTDEMKRCLLNARQATKQGSEGRVSTSDK